MFADFSENSRRYPVELLFIAPVLALTGNLVTGFSAGIIFLLLIVMVAVSVSVLRKFVSYQLRIPFLVLIIATLISLIELVLKACAFELSNQFGIYTPLLAVNSLVFACAEGSFLRSGLDVSLKQAFKAGVLILVLCTVTGALREILNYGTLFRDAEIILKGVNLRIDILKFDSGGGFTLAGKAPGAFLCCGLILALWNYLSVQTSLKITERN